MTNVGRLTLEGNSMDSSGKVVKVASIGLVEAVEISRMRCTHLSGRAARAALPDRSCMNHAFF